MQKATLYRIVALASAAGMVVALGGVPAHAADSVKCQQKKLKAHGKYELCIKRNAAKVLGGVPDASTVCQTKLSTSLSKAGTCRFLDNGDGTVTDLDTALIWERKNNLDGTVNAANLHDADNRYQWTANWPPFHSDGDVFTVFLYGLNTGTSATGVTTTDCFAGHCDWRLPTIEELQGILDLGQGACGADSGPCVDPVLGPTLVDETIGYWSISQFSTGLLSEQNVWAISFGEEDIGVGLEGFDKRSGLPARAVRGGF